MTGTPWHDAPLVALDLEGSGAQDRDNEAILEIATVPIVGTRPDPGGGYCTMINPGRPIPTRRWISPGLTTDTLRTAPTLATVEPTLAQHLDGRYIVGHNVGVDWRLLHRRCPSIAPAGLIDTLRIARHLKSTGANGLARLVASYGLTDQIDALAAGSQPHRALWDAIAAAVLLRKLIDQAWPSTPSISELTTVAGLALGYEPTRTTPDQPPLFEM